MSTLTSIPSATLLRPSLTPVSGLGAPASMPPVTVSTPTALPRLVWQNPIEGPLSKPPASWVPRVISRFGVRVVASEVGGATGTVTVSEVGGGVTLGTFFLPVTALVVGAWFLYTEIQTLSEKPRQPRVGFPSQPKIFLIPIPGRSVDKFAQQFDERSRRCAEMRRLQLEISRRRKMGISIDDLQNQLDGLSKQHAATPPSGLQMSVLRIRAQEAVGASTESTSVLERVRHALLRQRNRAYVLGADIRRVLTDPLAFDTDILPRIRRNAMHPDDVLTNAIQDIDYLSRTDRRDVEYKKLFARVVAQEKGDPDFLSKLCFVVLMHPYLQATVAEIVTAIGKDASIPGLIATAEEDQSSRMIAIVTKSMLIFFSPQSLYAFLNPDSNRESPGIAAVRRFLERNYTRLLYERYRSLDGVEAEPVNSEEGQ